VYRRLTAAATSFRRNPAARLERLIHRVGRHVGGHADQHPQPPGVRGRLHRGHRGRLDHRVGGRRERPVEGALHLRAQLLRLAPGLLRRVPRLRVEQLRVAAVLGAQVARQSEEVIRLGSSPLIGSRLEGREE
jgi:hypothetical protein